MDVGEISDTEVVGEKRWTVVKAKRRWFLVNFPVRKLGQHAMRRTGALLASALAIAQLQVPSQSEEEHAGSAY